MATCPNCEAHVSWDAAKCAACLAIFDEAGWQPVPSSKEEEELTLAAQQAREDAKRPIFLQTGDIRIWAGRRSVKVGVRSLPWTITVLCLMHVGVACMVLWLIDFVDTKSTAIFPYLTISMLPFSLIYLLGIVAPATIFPTGRVVRRIGWWRKQVELGIPLRVEVAPYTSHRLKEPALWGVVITGPRGAECVASGSAFAAETWRREIVRLLALVETAEPGRGRTGARA